MDQNDNLKMSKWYVILSLVTARMESTSKSVSFGFFSWNAQHKYLKEYLNFPHYYEQQLIST